MKININNQEYNIGEAKTILDVATNNGIYIPSLCAHPELIPYGGCRLCIVEVEGRAGYPTACTTLVEDGMVVRTETNTLKEMRKDLIQMILSEHTSACLVCDEIEGCAGFQGTIRKVGVTTGCRWCSKDKDCELQRIVEYLDIHELTLPGLYRGIPLEKYDPFFDRDYNLCIYCGRCVRICTEYRKSSILSLRQRGKKTTIGPAYNETHIDAGCEFCGACVSVCPTGAMSEKSRKWWGVPEEFTPSVCPLCSLNCDLQVLSLKNKIVGTLPLGEPHLAGGELCVKGRFCLSELVNRTERMQEPQFSYPEGYGFVTWDFAVQKAGEIIRSIPVGRSAVFISPGLSLEEISSAGLFAEKVLKTDNITSSCMDNNLPDFIDLAKESVTLAAVKNAGVITSFFLNGNYNYAPLTMAVKSAAAGGAVYFQAGWIKDTTTRFAKRRLIPEPGNEIKYFDQILSCLGKAKDGPEEIIDIAKHLKSSNEKIIIVGPEIMSLTNCSILLDRIRKIITLTGSKVFMPNQYGNLYGLLSLIKLKSLEEVNKKIRDGKIDLLWFIGDSPYHDRPSVKYLVYQNAFPAQTELKPDLLLPATMWGETGGSYVSMNGDLKKTTAVASSHRYELPHAEILSRISKSLKISTKLPVLKKKITIDGFNFSDNTTVKTKPVGNKMSSTNGYTHTLYQEKNQHIFNNMSLGEGLSGFADLVKPGHIIIGSEDARKLGIKSGDITHLTYMDEEKKFKTMVRKNVMKGILFLMTSDGETEFKNNPCPVKIRRENV
jgi:NADH dehydrogenase/NADH:ubiquinone oxidoreductase subunit G